ncbi:hypothetical protein [Methylobacterium iners]|uniref:Uncharacterized protein n=1 Tax=Methylobacterium iners TaxID=418707 RepID=A0ABQ4S078_9HYPH|nr:hypothetical protein [Methylobacterium iners]GJD96256.1 hypothetical protein OCOJLMKI_3476 [Methylobacterium iners]
MAGPQTIGELYKARLILEAEVAAAVDAYMEDSKATTFVFAGGYSINLMWAVRAQPSAKKLINDPEASEGLKRAVVRKAILLARPVRG